MQEQLPRTRSLSYIEFKRLFFFVSFVVKNVFSLIWIILSQPLTPAKPARMFLHVNQSEYPLNLGE
jgi:hypothetical protein